MAKLHFGCGKVYLKGYINVDVYDPERTILASEHPEEVEKNITDFEHYYQKSDFFSKGAQNLKIVVDHYVQKNSLFFIDKNRKLFAYPSNYFEEIVAVQVFEHIPSPLNKYILQDWYRMLKKGGMLFISVPDLEGNCKKFLEAKNEQDREFASRLIYGSGKGQYHYIGFWKEKLIRMLKEAGFLKYEDISPWIHFYPAIVLKAYK
jgi:SAM-dependent methyltransferase